MAIHVFDLAICNSWIEYKKHGNILKIPKKDIMDSMDFRKDVAESLIRVNKPNTPSRKKGRPLAQREQEQINTKKKVVDSAPPNVDRRLDGTYPPLVEERKYATKCKHVQLAKEHIHIVKNAFSISAWIEQATAFINIIQRNSYDKNYFLY